MNRLIYLIALFIIVGWLGFFVVLSIPDWLSPSASSDFPVPNITRVAVFDSSGTNQGRGNMLGIQPWMVPADYAHEIYFQAKLDSYLQTAQQRGWIIPNKTIVVFPEYLGTWLVSLDERTSIYNVPTIQEALTTMVVNHPIKFAKAYWNAPDSLADKTRYAVFAMKAQDMASAYTTVFSKLAALYQVTIVAGSILLPNPSVSDHAVRAGKGQLYNISAVFRPDGDVEPQLIRKVYPITDELPFVCPTNPTDVPVFDTPVGRLGVLVCADSWNSPVYKALKAKGAELLAVPSFSAGDTVWQSVWKGYSGTPTPADSRKDVGRLTEGQAWMAHAMAGRAKPEAGITKGLNVFLRGKLWDLGSDGTTIILNDSARTANATDGASLTCLWL